MTFLFASAPAVREIPDTTSAVEKWERRQVRQYPRPRTQRRGGDEAGQLRCGVRIAWPAAKSAVEDTQSRILYFGERFLLAG